MDSQFKCLPGGARRWVVLAVWLVSPVLACAQEEPEDPSDNPATLAAAEPQGGRGPPADDILNLDIEQLARVPIRRTPQTTDLTAPSYLLTPSESAGENGSTTGQVIEGLPSVTNRRISGINVDSRVRGYHSAQIGASVNGMTERKTVQDLDSLFSQIDPGVLQDMTVIDGPYSSLYGPGFAFLAGNLAAPVRYANGPESHLSTFFEYGSNGEKLYTRESVLAGSKDWGLRASFGLRSGNDYRSGGADGFLVPSAYQKWDTLLSLSFDLDCASRIEVDYLRNEMNNVDLAGITYDLDVSTANQFNVRYIVQEDRHGPEQLVLQAWFHDTAFHGDARREEKQQTFYYQFISLPYYYTADLVNTMNLVNTIASGRTNSLGVRALRTFGEADSCQWTWGVDWRRYEQAYVEPNINAAGEIAFGGNIFGIPQSHMDDVGVLTNAVLPMTDRFTLTAGGRVDYAQPWLNANDPVVTHFNDPADYFYDPGFSEPGRILGMAYVTGKLALTDKYTLNLGTGFGMRMPNLDELYTDLSCLPVARFGNSYVMGSSTLKPERNWQCDVGLSCKQDRLSYGVRGFCSTIWDYIMPIPAEVDWWAPDSIHPPHVLGRNFRYFPPEYRYDLGTPGQNADTPAAAYWYANVELATMWGGDVSAQFQVADGFAVYGSLSYVDGTNLQPLAAVYSDSGSYYYPVPVGGAEGLPGIYPLHGKFAVRIFEPQRERWSLAFSSRLVAAQNHVAVSLSELPSQAFATFDLHGYYQLRERLRLSMSIENIFNVDYSEPGSLAMIGPQGLPVFMPEPGISVGLGLEARF